MVAQPVARRLRPVSPELDVADESLPVAAISRPGHHRCALDGWVVAQRGLHLTGLDPVTADLDLLVHSTEKFECAIGPADGSIPGAVVAQPARLDEGRGGQLGLVEIAGGEARSGDQ